MAAPSFDHRQEAWASRWGWLVIGLAVVITYWPLSTFQYALAHGDALNCWLPWRWFISSCLMDGHFPLWNPHQQFGYPMHADLQGPAWYIESIALGGTIGHGIHALQSLFLLYVIIGGLGMMRLVRTLGSGARIGLVIGAAYALGGFFTGHQMHFYSVISAAWLPWLLDAAIRLFQSPGWRSAARVALFQGLLLTGGNHTFSIIACYLLLALVAVHAWSRWKAEAWTGIWTLLLWCFAAVVGASLIGAGVLHAWWEAALHLARAGGLAYDAAAVNPLTPQSLISLLFPFATGTAMERLGTDPPMANAYMGALMLPLAAAALLRKRTVIENVFLAFGAICAVVAFGGATPVHRWLWSNAPGLDLFRFPAYFRWFTWLAVLVLAAGTMRMHWSGELRRGTLAAVIASTAMIAIAVASLMNAKPDHDGFTLFERMRAIDLDRRVLIGAAGSLPVVIAALMLAWRRKLSFPWFLALVLLEMGWNTSLAQWNTAVSDIKPRWLHDRISSLSEGPVIPEMVPTSTYDDDNSLRPHHLAHNTQDFLGGFSRNGVNTFWLQNAMSLEVEHAALWNAMSRQPVAYLADSIIPWVSYVKEKVDADRDSGLVVLMPGVDAAASSARSALDRIVVTGFDRNSFTIACATAGPALLVLQQSHYPGWEVRVDGERQPLLPVNVAAMGVEVPAGSHRVEFRYRKPIVHWLLAISLITFFGLLFPIAFTDTGIMAKGGALILFASVCWSLFAHRPKSDRLEGDVERLVASIPDDAAVVMNDDGTLRNPLHDDMNGWSLRAEKAADAGEAIALLLNAEKFRSDELGHARPLYWVDAGLKADPAVRCGILDHWEATDVRKHGRAELVRLDPRLTAAPWLLLHETKGATIRWLTKESPFGSGCTISMDQLEGHHEGALVIDVMTSAPHDASAVVVIERKYGELTTEYRTLPISTARGIGTGLCYATTPVDELYRVSEELKVYLWSHRGDSISEQGFRVRVAPRGFHHW
ncbi:MAG: YfhO family protein [Flavobacteriales bacterium]|nr:YfhO family protein [Flavobacteriales bacterium]